MLFYLLILLLLIILQRHLSPLVYQSLIRFCLPCATRGNKAECKIYGGCVREISGPIFTHLWTKVYEISR